MSDVEDEPTARTPVPPAATDPLDGWNFATRDETALWGVIDVTGCDEAQIAYALEMLPVVVDRFVAQAPRDGFLTVTHVDYGSVVVADDRLFPVRNPESECLGQRAAALPSVEFLVIEPIDGIDGIDVVAYRLGPGDGVTAVVADDTGRAVIVTGARATDAEVRELVGQLAAHLRSGTD
jgi:hypothetical protein